MRARAAAIHQARVRIPMTPKNASDGLKDAARLASPNGRRPQIAAATHMSVLP